MITLRVANSLSIFLNLQQLQNLESANQKF